MAAPSLTYTLTNGSTADAAQVMQNFNDLLNGYTDGSKDLTVGAITVAGASVLQGTVTLGDGSVDDITWNGSLASTLLIKTNNTYNIGGATLGLAGVYLGAPSSRSTRVISNQSIASSYTLTLPISGGSAGQTVRCDGTGGTLFVNGSPLAVTNYGMTAAVGSNALTLALVAADGTNASSTNPIDISFRSSTLATGTPVVRQVTGALSVVVSSGSTLGHTSAQDHYLYLYAIDNAGTVELAVSSNWLDEGTRYSTTAEGGAGAADSFTAVYSTTARTNVAVRHLGRFKSNQVTAGTWAAVPTEASLPPYKMPGWLAFTQAGSWSSNTTYAGAKWRRVGDTLELVGTLDLAGAPTSASLTLTLPFGLSIDTAKVSGTAGKNTHFGTVTVYDDSAGFGHPGYVVYSSSATEVRLKYGSATFAGDDINATFPVTFAASDAISWSFRVPISGWD